MRTYQYTHPKEIESTEEVAITNDAGEVVAISKRVYDNILKKKWISCLIFVIFLSTTFTIQLVISFSQ